MSDIIQLLPDAVANQIAAGEVIQRPASVVKELLENAIDAGADEIKLIVKDAGKTLVQVIDNGKGMSETDARMAFERHATSKIKTADDLFQIRTKGFRGEALASIASIAQVELKTRHCEQNVGTAIHIAASEVEKQEPASTPTGSNMMVKNLFFNVPARRKFLKGNSTEFKHILNEFIRVAIPHSDIDFLLVHNDVTIHQLPKSNVRQRILNLMGKQLNQSLTRVETNTSLISVFGFVGKPEYAKKTAGEQYFFINQRYMRHPYFHRAVMKAYEGLIAGDAYPSYFLFFDTDPTTIDINIHPTKTEIKFENDQAIFQIISSAVKQALGKTNLMPSIDFETHGTIDIPVTRPDTEFSAPQIPINEHYNPFDTEIKTIPSQPGTAGGASSSWSPEKKKPAVNWEDLYEIIHEENERVPQQTEMFESGTNPTLPPASGNDYLQVKGKYILTNVKSGVMVINQRRAHERILYEDILARAQSGIASQRCLYPEQIKLSSADYELVVSLLEKLEDLGLEISDLGDQTIAVQGVPSFAANHDPKQLFERMIEEYKQTHHLDSDSVYGKMAASVAAASALAYGKSLSPDEMREITDKLFACQNPNYTARGKKTLEILPTATLEQLLG